MPIDFRSDFDLPRGRTWLNSAHQGVMPGVAVDAAREALRWKSEAPWELAALDPFTRVPARLKEALGRLINVPPDQVILGNSASYGLHLLANGLPFKAGDEILVVRGDFPSDILPWLALEDEGVRVRYVEPEYGLPTPGELEAALTPRTRLFCSTWVHSFSGVACDIEALGALCRDNDTWFVVNASQALGARPFSAAQADVDAVTSVGFKWLCGPYGTGFLWVEPELLRGLRHNQAYWLTEASDLSAGGDVNRRSGPPTAETYDVFGTANFMNFVPWTAAVEYLIESDIRHITEHVQRLVTAFIEGIDEQRYEVLSPRSGPKRSTLVFVSHRDPERNEAAHATLREQGIEVALRQGQLRIAPHLYNTGSDIRRTLGVLNSL